MVSMILVWFEVVVVQVLLLVPSRIVAGSTTTPAAFQAREARTTA